jgi:hypothetical protein
MSSIKKKILTKQTRKSEYCLFKKRKKPEIKAVKKSKKSENPVE